MKNIAKDTLINKINKLVAEVAECEPSEIKLESDFYKDLGIDSIKAIEVIVAIEKEFSISIRDKAIAKITTVKHAVYLVDKLLRKGKNIT